MGSFLPPLYKPFQAGSIAELAAPLGLEASTLVRTIEEFNRAAAGNTHVRPEVLDGLATRGLTPPKSNWARPIDRPPYYALPLRPGITFTYMGVGVDETARVVDRDGQPFENLYAAGEIMSGQHPGERIPRRVRHDDRRRVRPPGGKGGCDACPRLTCIRRPSGS